MHLVSSAEWMAVLGLFVLMKSRGIVYPKFRLRCV